MRITYRNDDIKDYWSKRWEAVNADAAMENTDAYPLRYALETIGENDGNILEAGCGAGRILRYFNDRDYNIVGFDFVESVVQKLKDTDPELNVETGNILDLKYNDRSFKYVLSFGLYHNLEHGLSQAIAESYRVLVPGGKLCASFRADNIQTRINDWLEATRTKKHTSSAATRHFHKMNLTRAEFCSYLTQQGFRILKIYNVENMPILYKFSAFRARGHKDFNESITRKEGYRLSFLGSIIQKSLMFFLARQFCNIYVVIAQRPE